MHMSRSLLVALALCGAVASVTLSGCAEERAPIDRVQPNALEKSMFTGQWYYQRTVVDVPSGNTFTAVGFYANVVRVRWDIQEDTLYARRTTELVKNADDKAETGEGYEGEVVAAFRIDKQFDIANAYNPTTGEKLNVVEENSTDRPWYERQYIRVDWSQNLVHLANSSFDLQDFESVAYYVQETDPETGERQITFEPVEGFEPPSVELAGAGTGE